MTDISIPSMRYASFRLLLKKRFEDVLSIVLACSHARVCRFEDMLLERTKLNLMINAIIASINVVVFAVNGFEDFRVAFDGQNGRLRFNAVAADRNNRINLTLFGQMKSN
jgi:hypothetical protein